MKFSLRGPEDGIRLGDGYCSADFYGNGNAGGDAIFEAFFSVLGGRAY
jgi:hypothetical protein